MKTGTGRISETLRFYVKIQGDG